MNTTDKTRRVIALGFFDGVHMGHGALLRRVAALSRELDAVPSAFTFDTHPENLIVRVPMPLLSSPMDRADLMRRYYGIRDVIVSHFDERMMKMPWREFVTDYLVAENGAVHLVAGHDFHFGYKGEGNPARLQDTCREIGVGCDIVPRVEQDHITVSSTYIRTLIAQGEMDRANYFLGHPHTLNGVISRCRIMGSAHGYPTVDLRFQPGVITPAHGVYACRGWLEGGGGHMAVVNVTGRSGPMDEQVEALLLDFGGADLTGRAARLEYYTRLRLESEFASRSDLRAEIENNEQETRDYFKLRGI